MHISVLLAETTEGLNIQPAGVYVDCTAGLGGHTLAIAERLTTGLVYACDRDSESLERARAATLERADRIEFIHTPFSGLRAALAARGVTAVDGLTADLGVSRVQLTSAERGFSLMTDGPLDMRMDRTKGETAADIVNFTDEKQLADLIYQLSEERRSRQIARALVRARPIHSTKRLADAVMSAVPRTGKLHPATLTFMALRIAVNEEFEELEALLEQAPELVRPGGRIAIISFHSLEDRRVKHKFQSLAREGRAQILTKHVVKPSESETGDNPASRSAKLRVLEMKNVEEASEGKRKWRRS
jgi:16S rRNA (cytosine1402-N4)-methyltransferase